MTQQHHIQIKASDDKFAGVYATHVNVTYTPEEFIIDFVNLLPNSPTGQLIQRIILSPEHTKRFSVILADLVKKHDNKEVAAIESVSSTVDSKIGFDLAKE